MDAEHRVAAGIAGVTLEAFAVVGEWVDRGVVDLLDAETGQVELFACLDLFRLGGRFDLGGQVLDRFEFDRLVGDKVLTVG